MITMTMKRLWALVLLAVAAQGAWADDETTTTPDIPSLSLSDGADNSSAISTASNDGNKYNVTLSGRTLYRDNAWNTLCLPFNMDAYQIAESPLAGTTIMELDGKTSNLDSEGKLTLNFQEATTIEAGKPYIVKWPIALTISSHEDWDTFANQVAAGETFAGKIVKLATNLTLTASDMVGSSEYPFKGIFDGGGHTLTCNITYTDDEGVAPFMYIQDATIMYVKVDGSVTGSDYCAGLVGFASGTNTIKNCQVDAYVTCSGAHCGGILGHGQTSSTSIYNCLFYGVIRGNGNTDVGVIYGWSESGGTALIDRCYADGKNYYGYRSLDMMLGEGTMTSERCCKSKDFGTMGKYAEESYGWTIVHQILRDYTNWQQAGNGVRLIMPDEADNLVNPGFFNVTIDNTDRSVDNGAEGALRVRFLGTYDHQSFSGTDRSILFMGDGNTLYYPPSGASIGACRAFFKIGEDGDNSNNAQNAPAPIRSFVLNFFDEQSGKSERGGEETTGIAPLQGGTNLSPLGEAEGASWYTLDGRRLNGKPSHAGVYINKGVKVIIK